MSNVVSAGLGQNPARQAARLLTVGEGTSDILRLLIARLALK
ncbi:MAG: hypothetical protein ABOK23_02095 [Candidatus Methanoperedens sp.]|nr:hypothetical protein [Candidatus Methanoperedens sp.]MCZ7395370.1 hypothetical protein [Candidatus Methanoperedens sp.]